MAARGVRSGVPDLPVVVPLEKGDHEIEVRFLAQQENAVFEFYWKSAGGRRRLLLPADLAPAEGGVWPAAERPGVASGPDVAAMASAPGR